MFRLLLVILCALSLSSCYTRTQGNTASLSGLKKFSTSPYRSRKTDGDNHIRRTAVQEVALSLGAQSGLAWRGQQINARLKVEGKKLDLTYNFQPLLLEHNVVPPILVQGDNTLNLASPSAIRVSDRTYKIEKQARFVTTMPNWRDYLWLNYTQPEKPDESLLPKNRSEQAIWDEYVTRGWHQGIRQANMIFSDNLARLTRDMKGMLLYRKLLAQHMVTPPYVATTELGVTGDDTKMSINDQVLRIAALPALNTNSKLWRPALSEGLPHHNRISITEHGK